MNKKSKLPIVIGLALVAILIINFAGPILSARVLDDTYTTVNINTKATSQIYLETSYLMAVSAGETVNMGAYNGYDLRVYYTLTATTFSFPDNSRFELVCDGEVIGVTSTVTLANPYTFTYVIEFANLGDVPQGTHSVYVRASGSWAVERADGYWNFYELVGQTYTIYLTSTDIAAPDPIELSNLPVDQQVEPYTRVSISWTYEYHGTMDIEVTDNGGSIYTGSVGKSLVPTVFQYSYEAVESGDHAIKAIFTPTDISGNLQVSDTMVVHINAGGDSAAFPPSIDRIDISVTQPIVGTEPVNIFVTGWFSDVAQKGTVSTVIDGELSVRVVVTPSKAFLEMKVIVSDDKTYPLQQASGWDGDVFSATIDTDSISEGLHTVDFWGRDAENAVWYKIASFTVPIRTSAAMIDPLLVMGVSVTLIGIVAVVIFSRRRRRN